MKTAIITGSAGLVGSAAVRKFEALGYNVIGIDNGMRAYFFGTVPASDGFDIDIRGDNAVLDVFSGTDADVVIHCAAQPSHDWAAKEPQTDFSVNAVGTLNLLEATRKFCPSAAFVFMSTNKVYGDWPNAFPYMEWPKRLTINSEHDPNGFDECSAIDQCTHSLFGASKLAADVMVQEYGRYFGMNTVCFRAGCITGPAHAGAPQHGFLSYLVKCCMRGTPYEVIGYGGKQVRDNIHAEDLADAFVEYVNDPDPGAVYNIGGGPERSCSVLEAIEMVERLSGRKMQISFNDVPRKGDHKWWITDNGKFQARYPGWRQSHTLEQTIQEMIDAERERIAA